MVALVQGWGLDAKALPLASPSPDHSRSSKSSCWSGSEEKRGQPALSTMPVPVQEPHPRKSPAWTPSGTRDTLDTSCPPHGGKQPRHQGNRKTAKKRESGRPPPSAWRMPAIQTRLCARHRGPPTLHHAPAIALTEDLFHPRETFALDVNNVQFVDVIEPRVPSLFIFVLTLTYKKKRERGEKTIKQKTHPTTKIMFECWRKDGQPACL